MKTSVSIHTQDVVNNIKWENIFDEGKYSQNLGNIVGLFQGLPLVVRIYSYLLDFSFPTLSSARGRLFDSLKKSLQREFDNGIDREIDFYHPSRRKSADVRFYEYKIEEL